MHVYQFSEANDPLTMALAAEAKSQAIKALKLYKRTGRISANALESIREAVAHGLTITAEMTCRNLEAELQQDEQLDGQEFESDGHSNVQDASIDAFLNRRAK